MGARVAHRTDARMSSPLDAWITQRRLEELVRWHGTDESNLPPAHTLQNLSRDTVAALAELRRSRERIEGLRAAMGRAFWAADAHELHAILLEALGPPPGGHDPPAAREDPAPRDDSPPQEDREVPDGAVVRNGSYGDLEGPAGGSAAGARACEWPATGRPS